MLFKRKKVVYSLAFFEVIYTRFAELECKQKLYDFPEDKNFKRSKVLVRELHKNYLKRSPKRQIRSANGDSRIADSNPVDLRTSPGWRYLYNTLSLVFVYCIEEIG